MAPKDKKAVDSMADVSPKDSGNAKDKGLKKEEIVDTLSEDDKELKERLETCVTTLVNAANEASVTTAIRNNALDVMVNELRTATASMTSVPKPLKFLRPHFALLKSCYDAIGDCDNELIELRARLSDVLAVLAMTMGKPEERESLKFKLAGVKDYALLRDRKSPSKHADDNLGSWGHEFVRSLAGEIGQEYDQRVIDGADPNQDDSFEDLLSMIDVIVPFHVSHNAESEAIDLLIEVQRLKNLLKLDTIDETNYQRICLYLIKTADYMSDPDDLSVRWCFCTRLHVYVTAMQHPFSNACFLLCRKCWKRHWKYLSLSTSTSTHYVWRCE
jgi:26S proteasome regulatory subunit N1